MKLGYIQEFLELSNTLNCCLAAQKLYISQPSLSRHIQAMERELGFPLVNTTNRGTTLTEFGQAAVLPFRRIVKEYDRFLEQCKCFTMQDQGTLSIGLPYYTLDDYFSDFFQYFMKKYPHIRVEFHCYPPQPLINELRNGRLDVASVYIYPDNAPDDFDYPKIGNSHIIAAMREDNPLAGQETVYLRELTQYPLIELRQDAYSNQLVKQMLSKKRLYFSSSILADNAETVPLTILSTNGIYITSESYRRRQADGLVYKPVADQNTDFSIGFASMESNPNPLVDVMLSGAAQFFEPKGAEHL